MSNSNYEVIEAGTDEFPLIFLRDGQGREVRIAPSAGFNAYAFTVPLKGESVDVLIGPESDEVFHKGGFSFGNPILFPFQNRTREGRYTFEGHEYQLDINWKDGHAIHGLVANKMWQVTDSGADAHKAWVTAQFATDSDPDVLRQYPFPCVLSVTYTLRDGALHLAAHVRNTGDSTLPMGFGIHPWFPAPFTSKGNRAECVLTLLAKGRWELESEEQLLPTGRILPLDSYYDFSQGAPLEERFLDDVYTGLIYENGEHVTRFNDPGTGVTLEVRASGNFREHVVYAPLDRDIICLEPYTSTTNFVNLSLEGVDVGLITLQTGETWRGEISIHLLEDRNG